MSPVEPVIPPATEQRIREDFQGIERAAAAGLNLYQHGVITAYEACVTLRAVFEVWIEETTVRRETAFIDAEIARFFGGEA